jgi:hypothetical protein
MPAGSTYTPIASTTLGSDTSTIDFSSIPSTYTDLILVCDQVQSNVAGSSINDGRFRFNDDTGTNYSQTRISGDGSAASSARLSNEDILYVGVIPQASNTTKALNILQIMNYANTTTFKTVLCRANGGGFVRANVGLWRSTSAITKISIIYPSQLYKAGSTFTLYGIASA